MNRFYQLIILLLISNVIYAQNGQSLIGGAKGKATSGADLNYQDIYALTSNIAGGASLEEASFGLYSEQRFATSDIRQVGLLVGIPTNLGSFGLNLHSFGFEVYNEQKIEFSYARKLSDNIALGIQFGYLNTRIAEYQTQGVLTSGIGLQAQIVDNLWLGVSLRNPFPVKITETDYLPTQLNLGLTYHFSQKLQIATAVYKDFEYPASIRVGCNYRIIQPLSLRLGISTEPIENSFGIGIHINQFDFDFAMSYHQFLGFTPAFSMIYSLRKTKEGNKNK